MKEELSLIIMAAGLGSRYGGLKQIESVGPNGEIIIDYSIYDAINAGFNNIIFVIKEEHYEIFKKIIGDKISKKVKVNYAFQSISDVPNNVDYSHREKPWGTLHAINCAKQYINGKFAIINADDFYGKNAFTVLANNLKELKNNEALSVTYKYCDTKSKNGAVKRGVCVVKDNLITDLIECSIVEYNNEFVASPLNGDKSFIIDKNTPVSMNMFGFNQNFYEQVELYLKTFFKQSSDVLEKAEALLPETVKESISDNTLKLINIESNSVWSGITYKEDLEELKNKIKALTEKGFYNFDEM